MEASATESPRLCLVLRVQQCRRMVRPIQGRQRLPGRSQRCYRGVRALEDRAATGRHQGKPGLRYGACDRKVVAHMNNLLYNARMALRDIIEIDIFTKGTDRVYVSLSPDPAWEGDVPETDQQREEREHAGRAKVEKVALHVVDRLRDMDLILAGGENGISALMGSQSVEILRKAA